MISATLQDLSFRRRGVQGIRAIRICSGQKAPVADGSMVVSIAAVSCPVPVLGLMAATPLATIIWLVAVFLMLGLASLGCDRAQCGCEPCAGPTAAAGSLLDRDACLQ